jgi:transcriptional regulator with XRE-family HTH domain
MSERGDYQLPLGVAIKAERELRKLSVETVAARAGVTEQWLLEVEAGEGDPTWGHLRRLAEAIGVPLPELMKRTEDCEKEEGGAGASEQKPRITQRKRKRNRWNRPAQGQEVRPQEALAKALSHELRAQALAILAERIASPKEIADELAEELSNVSYHVRVLEELGLIELVEEESVRGSVAHFYKAVDRDVIAHPAWEKLPLKVRSALSGHVVQTLLADVAASLGDGVFDKRKDRLLNRTPLLLDEDGWRRVIEIQHSAIEAILKEQASAGRRLEKSASGRVRAILGLLFFEAAPRKKE